MSRASTLGILASAAMVAAAGPGLAQYDRDGRYVPSPMGVPADPHARPVPLHSGTPGQAIGTPIWPRPPAPTPPPAVVVPRPPEPVVGSSRPMIRLKPVQCSQDWSAEIGLTRVEFIRRCRVLARPKP